ncbi:MAG: hypothetical protein U5K27_00245 [Desulfotignum sp.]|nr:hypothetical protein [Desulfotignum sp.]
MLVQTGILLLDDALQRRQAINRDQRLVEYCLETTGQIRCRGFRGRGATEPSGWKTFALRLADFLPIIALLSTREEHANAEESRFALRRNDILWYAAASGGTTPSRWSDWALFPMIQAKMLQYLAGQYGISWDIRTLADFVAALGAGFIVCGICPSWVSVQLRELNFRSTGKPFGSAAAVVVSFCSTYAIGRAACRVSSLVTKVKEKPSPSRNSNACITRRSTKSEKVQSRETSAEPH